MERACKLCGKVGQSELEMNGHVLRNHADQFPAVIEKFLRRPEEIAAIRRENRTGLYDKLLRVLDTARGVETPVPVFPDADVLLSNGTRLAHQGRHGCSRLFVNDEVRLMVMASWEMDHDHVSVSQRPTPPTVEMIEAVRCAFFGADRKVESTTSPDGVIHLLAPPAGPRPPPYPEPPKEASHPRTQVRTEPKVGRNEPCPCGSGKKHKRCCGLQ